MKSKSLAHGSSAPSALFRLAAMLCVLALAACGRDGHHTQGAAENVLNVYSWSEYIGPDTVAEFEKETGIQVRYDTYDGNETLETKLLTGRTNYDVVLPTGTFFERQMHAGVYRKLDKAALPNLANADPEILRRMALHDPGNQYAVPYMWTVTGLGYDTAKVRTRLGHDTPDGWSLLLDPANASKMADCGINIIDAPMDVFGSVMLYLGRDPNRFDPDDLRAASAVLRKIRPYVRTVDIEQYWTEMANGSLCLSLGWSGDVEHARQQARAAGRGIDLVFRVPREGALITIDMMAIPADAPHPQNAERWMNYLMRPRVMAAISNAIGYPNGYSASLPYLDPAMKAELYPDAATRARLVTPIVAPLEYSRLVTREWTRFRTGE